MCANIFGGGKFYVGIHNSSPNHFYNFFLYSRLLTISGTGTGTGITASIIIFLSHPSLYFFFFIISSSSLSSTYMILLLSILGLGNLHICIIIICMEWTQVNKPKQNHLHFYMTIAVLVVLTSINYFHNNIFLGS